MLNTDMELAYNIDVDDLEGTSCSINENAPGPGGPGGPNGPEGPNGPGGPGGPNGPGGRGGGGRGRGGRGGNRGGNRGASNSNATPPASGSRFSGPKHPDLPAGEWKGCRMHHRWGKSAHFCSEPFTCPWKDIFTAKPTK